MNDSNNNFKINPCKACRIKCPDPSDVNCINNCCMETLGAFMGASSINEFRNTPEAENCKKCMDDAICEMGSNTCDLRLTEAPIFNQVPHYFPNLLDKHKNVQKAKILCYNFCLDCKNCENECVEKCDIDSSAVESYEKKIKTQNKKKIGLKSYKMTNPASFYTGLTIAIILTTLILILWYANKF